MKENLINVQMSEEFYNEKFLKMGAGTESTMEYLDVSELSEQNITQIRTFAFMAKADVTDFIIVAPAMYIRFQESASNFNRYLAFGLDLKAEVVQGDIRMTINDLLKDSGFDIDSIPRITKEQFYDLSSEEDSGALKEGDVLYYSCPSTDSSSDTLKDLIKIKDNIVTVAAARAETDTGSYPTIQSFINGENLEWTKNTTYGYVSVSTSNYISLDIIGFSFKVGSDLKTALDIIGTPIGGEITQITQEEYENIFNS